MDGMLVTGLGTTQLQNVLKLGACDVHMHMAGWTHGAKARVFIKAYLNRNLNRLNTAVWNHWTRNRDGYIKFAQEFQQLHQGLDFWPEILACGDGEMFDSTTGMVKERYPVLCVQYIRVVPQ